jgi:hypothetical protein
MSAPDNTPWTQLIAALLAALGQLQPPVEVTVQINGTAWDGTLAELSAALEATAGEVVIAVSPRPPAGT